MVISKKIIEILFCFILYKMPSTPPRKTTYILSPPPLIRKKVYFIPKQIFQVIMPDGKIVLGKRLS
jgi:hypothetical protein